MYKKIIAMMLAAQMFSISVFATAQIESNPEEGVVNISGNIGTSAQVKEVSVLILNPDKTLDDLNGGDRAAAAYIAQIPVRMNGTYGIRAAIQGDSGVYTIYVDYEGNTDKDPVQIRYVRKADILAAAADLFRAASAEDAVDVMRTKWEQLDISNAFYDVDTCEKPAKIFYGLKTETPVTEPTISDLQSYFAVACTIAAISEGKIDNLADYLTVLGLTDDAASGYYKKGNAAMRKSVVSRITSSVAHLLSVCDKEEAKWATVKSAFDKVFDEAIVLATVEHPSGVGDVTEVIKTFSEQIGIDSLSGNSKVYYDLMSKKFDTYSALLDAYNKAVANADSSGSTHGGGSGGGSGGVVRGDKAAAVGPALGEYSAQSPENIGRKVNVFNDIADVPWAIEAISDLTERGVLSGMGDGSFKPNDAVTREQFVKMIVTAFGMQAKENDMAFYDVKYGDWYYDAVKIAFDNEIIRGQGAGFGVGEELTREDMAVIIFNTLTKLGVSKDAEEKPAFIDSAEIADYAKESVEYLKNIGVLNGSGNNDFNPKNATTRAEASIVIFSLLNNNR